MEHSETDTPAEVAASTSTSDLASAASSSEPAPDSRGDHSAGDNATGDDGTSDDGTSDTGTGESATGETAASAANRRQGARLNPAPARPNVGASQLAKQQSPAKEHLCG
jgi:hypothetical protein